MAGGSWTDTLPARIYALKYVTLSVLRLQLQRKTSEHLQHPIPRLVPCRGLENSHRGGPLIDLMFFFALNKVDLRLHSRPSAHFTTGAVHHTSFSSTRDNNIKHVLPFIERQDYSGLHHPKPDSSNPSTQSNFFPSRQNGRTLPCCLVRQYTKPPRKPPRPGPRTKGELTVNPELQSNGLNPLRLGTQTPKPKFLRNLACHFILHVLFHKIFIGVRS